MTESAPGDVVQSERLFLPLLTASHMERILASDLASVGSEIGVALPDWWLAEVEGLVRLRLRQVQESPDTGPWLLRPIVRRGAPPKVVGLTNFHGPPDDRGFAEIGYQLRPEHRGQGYAVEAVRAMFDWAAMEHGVRRFRASIAPDNDRSRRLAGKLGMAQVGAHWDPDDGLELIYTVEGWGAA